MDNNNIPKDITHLTEIVHNFLEMNGALSMSQYKQFWNNLCQDQNSSTNYFSILFAKLITLDLGIDKNATLIEVVKKLCTGEGPMDGVSQTKPISQSSLSSDEGSVPLYGVMNYALTILLSIIKVLYIFTLYHR